MAGLVSHMRWVEHLWFEIILLGGPAQGPHFDDGPEDAETDIDPLRAEIPRWAWIPG